MLAPLKVCCPSSGQSAENPVVVAEVAVEAVAARAVKTSVEVLVLEGASSWFCTTPGPVPSLTQAGQCLVVPPTRTGALLRPPSIVITLPEANWLFWVA